MQADEIIDHVKSLLPQSECYYQGIDCNFTLTVVDDCFANLSTLKRQQLVLSALSDLIKSGALHAISIKTYTPIQWQAFNVQ